MTTIKFLNSNDICTGVDILYYRGVNLLSRITLSHCTLTDTKLDTFSITVTNDTCRVLKIATNTFKYKAVVCTIVRTVFLCATTMREKVLRVT